MVIQLGMCVNQPVPLPQFALGHLGVFLSAASTRGDACHLGRGPVGRNPAPVTDIPRRHLVQASLRVIVVSRDSVCVWRDAVARANLVDPE